MVDQNSVKPKYQIGDILAIKYSGYDSDDLRIMVANIDMKSKKYDVVILNNGSVVKYTIETLNNNFTKVA